MIKSSSNECVNSTRCRCKTDQGWEMDLIAEFVFWMALFAQYWRFQLQNQREAVHGFPHQLNLFLEGVIGFASGLHLKTVANCHDWSGRHFVGVVSLQFTSPHLLK
jgi:hypothetical protein